jgi:hypothetical protein
VHPVVLLKRPLPSDAERSNWVSAGGERETRRIGGANDPIYGCRIEAKGAVPTAVGGPSPAMDESGGL